jgi:hypothetical protein
MAYKIVDRLFVHPSFAGQEPQAGSLGMSRTYHTPHRCVGLGNLFAMQPLEALDLHQ